MERMAEFVDGGAKEMSAPVTKAVLLAAGKGTRMRELTNELPKPMIEVRGKPILLHIVEGLRAAGVTRFPDRRRLSRRCGARFLRRRIEVRRRRRIRDAGRAGRHRPRGRTGEELSPAPTLSSSATATSSSIRRTTAVSSRSATPRR